MNRAGSIPSAAKGSVSKPGGNREGRGSVLFSQPQKSLLLCGLLSVE